MRKKKISKERVIIALSGGVDSSVAALLLKQQGYNVIAAFMKNFSDTKNHLTNECLWIEEREMAKRISSILKIPFYTFDFEKEYKSLIIKKMFADYKSGITPNPDISCNTIIKFPLFWEKAKKLKADFIAFGHYARIKKTRNGYQLLQGKDKKKDQSYFLSGLSQEDLSHTIFPLGNYTKEKVRQIAEKNNFPNWNKSSTKGICFVGKIDMHSFLKKKIKEKNGLVLDPEGNVIGKHKGIFYFTIGQKIGNNSRIKIIKTLGNQQKKWYVAEKSENSIVAAPENHPVLKKSQVIIKKLHLINPNEKIPNQLKARIRHLGKLNSGKLVKKRNKYSFIFSKPLESVAEGQSLVLYCKERLIGSGEIEKTF